MEEEDEEEEEGQDKTNMKKTWQNLARGMLPRHVNREI